MKIFLNWRYYVMFLLMFVGFTCLSLAAADPETTAQMKLQGIFFIVGIASIYISYRLTVRWERKGRIPEYTNQDKDLE